MLPRQTLARNVRHLMEGHGHSAYDLARISGVSQRTVLNIINADTDARLDTVDAIAEAYGLAGWHLIIPTLPADLIDSPAISKMVGYYAKMPPEDRSYIDTTIAREASRKK